MGGELSPLGSPVITLSNRHQKIHPNGVINHRNAAVADGQPESQVGGDHPKTVRAHGFLANAAFMKWGAEEVLGVARDHRIPCALTAALLFFMWVEYTLRMIHPSSPPFDLGFVATDHLHRILASNPNLNTLLAGLNTVFVGMQTMYILGTWVLEGRPRATIAALFMFTCRGILGYSTQLPLPQGFLGSGVDFPVGNVSFFLFYSGHVAASVIASLDMRRMQRWKLARTFNMLNFLQVVRLLGSRGHYTIDLVAGVGAGILFDLLAGKYEEGKKKGAKNTITNMNGSAFINPPTKKLAEESPRWSALN